MGEKLTKLREWGFFILAVATLVIGILTLNLYYESTLTKKPDIEIKFADSSFFSTNSLSRINHFGNGSFQQSEESLNFQISNLGMKDSGYLNIYVKDYKEEYYFKSAEQIKNLESLQSSFFDISFWSKDCMSIYRDAINEKQSYNLPLLKCSKIEENLTIGPKELILKVDCPGCLWDKTSKCYKFNICVYNSNNSLCDSLKDNQLKLKETKCPENWW